jgi:hypothetical protein
VKAPAAETAVSTPASPLYEERRRLSLMPALLSLFFVAGALWVVVGSTIAVVQGELAMSSALVRAAAATGFSGFMVLLFLGPWSGERQHLRVDAEGVHVRSRLLPAERIGTIGVLSDAETAKMHWSMRVRGMSRWRGVNTYSYFMTDGTCVLLEEHRPDGSRRPWLLGTTDPRAFTTAVHRCRAAVAEDPTEVHAERG